jgi:cell wall assembly regulator SMI1
MKEIWTRIEIWLQANAPKIFDTLQDGASDLEIRSLEDYLSITFPDDARVSFQIHNGQSDNKYYFFKGGWLLTLEGIRESWQSWQDILGREILDDNEGDPDEGIRPNWWIPQWIPISLDIVCDSYCLDLNPDKEGTIGQVVRVLHDHEYRERVSYSFRELLEQYADNLESGKFFFSEEYECICTLDELEHLRQILLKYGGKNLD